MRGMAPYMLMRTIGQPGRFTAPVNGERPGKKPKKGVLSAIFTGGAKKSQALPRVQDPRLFQGARPGMVPAGFPGGMPAMMPRARPGMVPMGVPRRMPPMVPRAPQGRFAPIQQPVERIVDRKTGAVYVRQELQRPKPEGGTQAPVLQQLRQVRMPAPAMRPQKIKPTLQQRGERLKKFLLSDESAGWG